MASPGATTEPVVASAGATEEAGRAGEDPQATPDARYRWVTYYTSGTSWIWATPGSDHRRTYLRCGSQKLNKIDFLRRHEGAERIFVTRNCLWNGKDGYSYTIMWQKRVLAGPV